MSRIEIRGVIVPMVTPVTAEGRVDRGAVERLAEHLVAGGCHPLVMGTTGEGASIPEAERESLVRWVVGAVAGRAPVYAGVSSNVLDTAIAMGRRYLDLGAAAVLSHLPCYLPIGPGEMLAWYERLADGIGGPLILYNIPQTTGLSLPLEVADELSHHPHVHGLKDSQAGMPRLEESARRWSGRADFAHLVGVAEHSVRALALGSNAIVPSAANLAPGAHRRLYDATVSGDAAEATRLEARLDELLALYAHGRSVGESLAALKVLASALGLCGPEMLPPLRRLGPSDEATLLERMRGFDPYSW